jgi:hypothetical protein
MRKSQFDVCGAAIIMHFFGYSIESLTFQPFNLKINIDNNLSIILFYTKKQQFKILSSKIVNLHQINTKK